MEPLRIAVVDLGTNSTRLLVAEVSDGQVTELERRTNVTRLGEGVDQSGRLSDEAVARVVDAVSAYRQAIDRLGARRTIGVATSAVREAENGTTVLEQLAECFGIHARTLSGEEEARLTFLGATAGRQDRSRETMVLDIGGGSTEVVVGVPGQDPAFHVSTPLGSVRHTERHLHADPPAEAEIAALAGDARATLEHEISEALRERVTAGIAVAGTATSLAAIDLELDPYDAERVHGHRLELGACERMLVLLAGMPLSHRREVTGLHPDRAPTIVAGAAILVAAMRAFDLEAIEVSEVDLLHGAVLDAAQEPR